MNVNMTSPDGVTLATSGKYCEDNITVTPDFLFAANTKKWSITVASNITANLVPLLNDSWLAANRTNAGLCLAIVRKSDAPSTGGYIAMNIHSNKPQVTVGGITRTGITLRAAASAPTQTIINTTIDDSGGGLGALWVTESGDLCITCTTSSVLLAGDYSIIAWLM